MDISLNLAYVALSILGSWHFTRKYYLKSLDKQESAYSNELKTIASELKKLSPKDEILLTQNYIDESVKAWKQHGNAIRYLDSLDIPNNQKSKILIAAALRHKGRQPKNNPYV